MAGECTMNNTLLLENAFSANVVKEECQDVDFADDKVHISETAIVMNSVELQDHLIQDKMEHCDISTNLENIKAEFSSSKVKYDMIRDNLKIEEGISNDYTKSEFNKALLYCEDCHVYCEEYCAKCEMLVHILNGIGPINADITSREDLPNDDILKIQHYLGEFRVITVKSIPAGVRFGPFTGLNRTECSWKLKGGKIVVNSVKSMYFSWMQYINPARSISEQNLLAFQYEHDLYYRSTRQIQEGDELLVYFGEEYEDSLNRDVEIDFIPTTELIFKDAFACTFCCLGFSSKSYLAKHKTICPANTDRQFSIEEIMQCPSCKIYLDQKEYKLNHMGHCCERNGRKCIHPTPSNRVAQITGRKTRARMMYKCQQCKYRTKYKGALKKHTNQHYEVKIYKCGVCRRQFKTKEVLRLHMESRHICASGGKGHSIGDHIKTEHSCLQVETKQFKCSLCEFRSKYKLSLKRHTGAKHSKNFNYECLTCDYKTNRKTNLKTHVDTKHLKEFKYKCDTCDYKTNKRSNLKAHVQTRHLREFKYKCDACDYKTNRKIDLRKHIETRHLKEFEYNCDLCDYQTNKKSNLRSHIETRHLKEYKYKCDICDYETNRKSELTTHIETRHLKEFKYKCDICDYKTNKKSNLKAHIEAKHLKEFKYKCETCDYKTNSNAKLKTHIETRHLKEFKYKCDTCEYKTNHKSNLKSHVETIHLKVFKHKCDTCDYKTNSMSNLKIHVETKHMKEFKYKCDTCDYKTNFKKQLKTHGKAIHLR